MTLLRAPSAWASSVAGTKVRLVAMIAIHLLGWVCAISLVPTGEAQRAGPPLFLFGVWFPAFYLYALHRMVRTAPEPVTSPGP